ncbi:MAG: signal peptidase II, partial [Alphaproteobacteria bacterium]|nr:signal peptidase II [Alphaproteobacteria bacterium]
MKKSVLYSLLIVFLVIILDQVSKGILLYMILGSVPVSGEAFQLIPYPYLMSQVTGFFNLVFTWNPGTSFSLFRSLGESAPLVIIAITGVIIGFLGYQLFARKNTKLETVALAMIVGGALGNLIDRIRFGAVIDFLDFHIGRLHWPAFNVADICITIGVILFIISWIINIKGKK